MNGEYSGDLVRIYKNVNGTWTKIGNDIIGDPNDYSGGSVSLSLMVLSLLLVLLLMMEMELIGGMFVFTKLILMILDLVKYKL